MITPRQAKQSLRNLIHLIVPIPVSSIISFFFAIYLLYSNNDAKVTFALSYLHDTVLEYFEPALMDSNEIPEWMDDWSSFVRNLCVQFRSHDLTADAEDSIDNLKM